MSPTVTAVIPTRNRCEKTRRFLQEFTQQTYPNLKIIVVDANSTDGTPDIIVTNFPDITLLHANDECYWTASTNIGIRQALQDSCDFILTINDDTYLLKDYLEKLVAAAQKHQSLILGSRVDFLTRPGLIWSLGAYSRWGTKHLFQLHYNDTWEDDLPTSISQSEIIAVEALAGNGVLIHRSVFEQIGLYNERYLPHYHADSELTMRAKSCGIQPFVTPLAIVYNDFPLPIKKEDRITLPSESFPLADFWFSFFHKKSHLFLPPTIYVIWKYCPNHKKLPTFLLTAIVYPVFFLVASILNKYWGINRRTFTAFVKKVGKSTVYLPNRVLTLIGQGIGTWQLKKH